MSVTKKHGFLLRKKTYGANVPLIKYCHGCPGLLISNVGIFSGTGNTFLNTNNEKIIYEIMYYVVFMLFF